jgi:rRNA maturation RNase YbeY
VIDVSASDEVGVDLAALEEIVTWCLGRLGVAEASVGLMVVGPERMRAINSEHRGVDRPTDVLAFPVDGPDAAAWPDGAPPPELGDVVICPDAAEEPLTTLAVHGLLHLLGHDHETDDGAMLALQDELVGAARSER